MFYMGKQVVYYFLLILFEFHFISLKVSI